MTISIKFSLSMSKEIYKIPNIKINSNQQGQGQGQVQQNQQGKPRENKFANSNNQNVDFKQMNTSPLLRVS